MKIGMRKNGNKLEVVDDVGLEVLSHYKDGDYILVTPATARNPKFHNRYWAMIRFVRENLPERYDAIDTSKKLHYITKRMLAKDGYSRAGEFIHTATEEWFIPAKTDFGNMTQEEFSEYSKFAVVFWNRLCGFDVEEQFEIHRF